MDTKDTEGKAAETRSGPATGYATAVDAALHLATSGFTCARFQTSAKALGVLADMKNGDIYSEVAAKVLAEEVLRLRASTAEEVYGAMSIDARRLDWLDKRLDYFGRISLRLQGNPERCIIAEEAPDECGNYHNGDEIGSSAGKLLRSAIDDGMSPRANPHAVATAIGHEGWPHAVSIKAGEALAAEVRRLRGRVEELEAQLAGSRRRCDCGGALRLSTTYAGGGVIDRRASCGECGKTKQLED